MVIVPPSLVKLLRNESARPEEYGSCATEKTATLFLLILSWTKRAATSPCCGSVKHTRKVYLRFSVTDAAVDDGVTIGTFFFSQISPPASDRLDATSPRMARAPSRSMSC